MEKNELRLKLEKEQKQVEELKGKRVKLDKQIKEKSEKIIKYENQIKQIEMTELEKNLANNGMSLNELKQAISIGDLSEIQEKLKKAKV